MRNLPEGYKVFVTHFRRWEGERAYMTKFDGLSEGLKKILPTGGATEAVIMDPEGNLVASAYAACSKRDHFSKRIGRDIAVGRAIKRLEALNVLG